MEDKPLETPKKTRRPKGDGSIQKLGKDKYKVQITVGYDANGKQRKKSFTGTHKEVLEAKKKFQREQHSGTLVISNSMKLSEYIPRWLEMKKSQVKATTYDSYVSTCRDSITPFLGKHSLQKLTTAHVNDYIVDEFKRGLSSATVSRHKVMLNGILSTAVREGIIGRNVAAMSSTVTKKQDEIKVFSPEQTKKLLEAAKVSASLTGRFFNQLYYIVLFALATGARRGEILGARWENIDFEKGTWSIKDTVTQIGSGTHIDTPKTKSSLRTIPVDKKVLSELQVLNKGCPWVFHTLNGGPLNPAFVGKVFRKLVKDIGLKGWRFHDLRHTHATRSIDAGHSIKEVSERLGHSTIAITLAIYVHTTKEMGKKLAEDWGSWLL